MSAVITTAAWLEDFFTRMSALLQPSWLKDFRALHFDKFLQHGLPTTKEEWWKYTDVAYLAKSKFTFPAVSTTMETQLNNYNDSPVLLVFNNGHFSPEMSRTDLLPDNVVLSSLKLVLGTHDNLIKPYLLQEIEKRHPFSHLNSAFMHDGLFLQVPENCSVPCPIHLLFLNTEQDSFMSCPRNIIIAHKNSQVKIIEEHLGVRAENYFTNVVTELYAYPNARLDYYKLQNEHSTATHIANIKVQQKQDSTVNTFFADCGSRMAREDLTVNLHENNAACYMNGLYLLEHDEQHLDNHIFVDHAATHGVSSMLYKGILDKKSQAVFNGKVYAHQGAKKTDAMQANHNLLLSSTAEVNTKPELEIYEDDVKCVHGATVGQLNADAMFYLRARGVEKEEALKILSQAFIAEVIQTIADPFIKKHIQQRVLKDAIL